MNNENKNTVKIIITHQNSWDPEKHGAAFLQPMIEGFLRRFYSIKA